MVQYPVSLAFCVVLATEKLAAAERVGPSGHVFSTELDPNRLADIKANVTKRKLASATIIKAGEADTNLPSECCDAIFVLYHHLTHPAEINVSIFRVLKPDGLVAVIDFPPSKMLGFIAPLKVFPQPRRAKYSTKQILLDFHGSLVYPSLSTFRC